MLVDNKVKIKDDYLIDKYLVFARELKTLLNMRMTIMPIVVASLGMTPKAWKRYWENWGSEDESGPSVLKPYHSKILFFKCKNKNKRTTNNENGFKIFTSYF